jgi:hypothetical protein
VGAIILAVVFLVTVAIGAALAKAVLALLLHLVVEGQFPTLASLRITSFFVALIAFWSLGPALVESPVAASLLALVR